VGDVVDRDYRKDTLEGWTTLAAMAVVVKRARIGCLVTGVTYRHPAVLAKMAVTVDHISGGRLEFGLGAAWHEAEHDGYGIPFPRAGERIAMLDEALQVITALWTEKTANFNGQYFRLQDAIGNPKPVQKPHPPIVVAGQGRKSLLVVATHADEWNATGIDPGEWSRLNQVLTSHCDAVGRDPATIRRGVQLFIHPAKEPRTQHTLDLLPTFEAAGCQHAVLSFYQPPTEQQLERAASYSQVS
jgi:alkanesulfonate monooxygenase SsuD/methylene tetrahydromethanopterin reductase-like flavin-dependent oxidoreductase (luciferase family)